MIDTPEKDFEASLKEIQSRADIKRKPDQFDREAGRIDALMIQLQENIERLKE